MIHVRRISVEVMLPLENVIQRQLAPMNSKVYDLTMWVGGIPLGFPSILTHDITVDSRYLKRSPHIILMDMLFELLHDLQVQHKLILNVFQLLDVLASCIFRLEMEASQEFARKRLCCCNPICNIYLRTRKPSITLAHNNLILLYLQQSATPTKCDVPSVERRPRYPGKLQKVQLQQLRPLVKLECPQVHLFGSPVKNHHPPFSS
jgi:hypothetical protein